MKAASGAGEPGATAVDRVVIALRQAMFDGDLRPGTHLREQRLSEKFTVSRSTVREAVRVLTEHGLLTRRPNRSVMVRHLTVDEVEDIYRARAFLEGASISAAATCPEESLQELAKALDRYLADVHSGNPQRAAEAHVEFHATMVGVLTQSQWLADTERAMMRHLLLIIASVHRSRSSLEHEIQYHRAMCEFCLARRVDDALACLEEGFREFKSFAIRCTFEALKLAQLKKENS